MQLLDGIYFKKTTQKSFSEADHVFIAEPYDQTKIPESERFSSQLLTSDLSKAGTPAETFSSTVEGLEKVAAVCSADEVVAVLSNGGFDGFIDRLINKLEKKG